MQLCTGSHRGEEWVLRVRVTWGTQQLLSELFDRDANLFTSRKASHAYFYVSFCFALRAFDFIFKPAVFMVLKMSVFC